MLASPPPPPPPAPQPAIPSPIHSGDSGNPPATGVGPDMPGMPHRFGSSFPIPSNFEDILPPSPYTTYWGYLSQADTPLGQFFNMWLVGSRSGHLRRARA